jgi:hypothetical protein
MDSPVSVFDICQAHAQLEADYNNGGIVWERPSNRRRNESTGCQLARLRFDPKSRWIDICSEHIEDSFDDEENVRDIYLINVLKWGLPMDAEMREFIGDRYTKKFLSTFPHWSQP